MPTKTIDWRYIPAAEGWEDYEADVALWLDVAKVDAAWRRTDQYIAPGGANGQDQRYQRAGKWFAKCPFSNMLIINLQTSDQITFTDGRHRFSWLRDHGAKAIQFQVSPADAGQFAALFGTDFMATVVEIPDQASFANPTDDRT